MASMNYSTPNEGHVYVYRNTHGETPFWSANFHTFGLFLSDNEARKVWSALDAHFANEENTKAEADRVFAADGSLVDPDGNVVPFVADHV